MSAQLGRPARGAIAVGWRCPCGNPAVTLTAPRLPDGTPFPTMYYLSCPRAVSAVSRLEANGLMDTYNARLATEPELAEAYAAAHQSYLADRAALPGGTAVPETDGVSAGGMPTRVKCLHALLAHALAAGPGVNPIGDEVRELIGEFWGEPCLP
ncbi:MAG: DUF501 domain-containing protein [Propionibacteriaceae bacterium]|nr:DUF501 domain-containing protein [Propionibacteriaceae bacterium]